MNSTLRTNLRFGWTTGTCATAATYAAYRAMVSGEFPQSVTIDTPSGKTASLEVASASVSDGAWRASIIKDAGDDPDVTHGAEIVVSLKRGVSGSGVSFAGGEGVGTVTKAGLPIGVGEPAINPVPRATMTPVMITVPTYTGGQMALGFGCKDKEFLLPSRESIKQKLHQLRDVKQLKVLNEDVFFASFALPNFVQSHGFTSLLDRGSSASL